MKMKPNDAPTAMAIVCAGKEEEEELEEAFGDGDGLDVGWGVSVVKLMGSVMMVKGVGSGGWGGVGVGAGWGGWVVGVGGVGGRVVGAGGMGIGSRVVVGVIGGGVVGVSPVVTT